MAKELLAPDYIFEASWEVCNKVGGIYTVLSTRAKTLQEAFKDKVFFIGPDFWAGKENPLFSENENLCAAWREHALKKDGLKVPVCNNCHNMGQKLCRIHENPMAERMSKMIGQLAWEREWLLKNTVTINSKGQMAKVEGNVVRSQFMKRYGRSYL